MPFSYDGQGIDLPGMALPDGKYVLRIISAVVGVTKNGDPKVTVDYVVASGPFEGRSVKFHTITFFKDKKSPAAGMAIHYLKCLGEPYEGQFSVNEAAWIGKSVEGMVVGEKANDGNVYSRVKFVNLYVPDHTKALESDPDVPF